MPKSQFKQRHVPVDILKLFPLKAVVIAEFRQTSLASSEISPGERLQHDARVFCSACGDLASLLMLYREAWTAEKLRPNTLLVLAATAFDEVMMQIQERMGGAGDLFRTSRQLQSVFEWLVNRAGKQDDVRQAVVLAHALSVNLQKQICPPDQWLQVHPDLTGLWAEFLPNPEQGDWDLAFGMWSSAAEPLAGRGG